MSSSEKKNTKGRVRALTAWEWFKEAAWLQVLLIVGVVVGVVVSIPFVVKAIANAAQSSSTFYDEHRISYTRLNEYLLGSKDGDGYIGDYSALNDDGTINFNNDKEGFVVMFYKSNCSNCETLQEPLENWFNDFNKQYGKGRIKLYTIDISWDTDDDDLASTNEGIYSEYNNDYITIEQQNDVQDAIKNVYLNQDDDHQSSSVTEETLNKDLTAATDGGTLPTPCFVTFSKATSATNYLTVDQQGLKSSDNVIQYTTPTMVMFGPQSGLSYSNASDVAVSMMDIYHFEAYRQQK